MGFARLLLFAAFVLFVPFVVSSVDAEESGLDAVVRRYLSAATPAEREKLAPELAPFDATPVEELTQALTRFMPRPAGPGPIDRTVMTNKGEVRYSILLPEGYDPDKAYPVLVFMAGLSMEAENTLIAWPTESLGEKYIVAAPSFIADGTEMGGRPSHELGDTGLEGLFDDLPRAAHVDPSQIFVGGIGLGGELAWGAAVMQADRLAGAFPMSSRPPNYASPECLRNTLHVPLFIAHAARDTTADVHLAREAVALLREYGRSPEYHEVPGIAYEWPGPITKAIVSWMQGRRRDLFPKDVSLRLLYWGRPTRRMYWVEATKGKYQEVGTDGQTSYAEIVGKREGNRIELTTRLVEKVTVYLNSAMVDLSKEVVVVVNGEERYREVVKPSLRVALEGFRERWDPEDLYSAKVLLQVPK